MASSCQISEFKKVYLKDKVEVKFTLEQATKAQWGIDVSLLFL